MGNSVQGGVRFDELFLYLQTNDAYYNPGAFVSGAVYLDIYRPITIYNVELRLRGTERVKWEELKSGPQTDANKITEKMKDKVSIFNTTNMLYGMAQTLPPGQYQFPFSFQLPDQIPGTFEIKHFDFEGRIRYTLTAVLNCEGRDPIKYRTDLVVRQRPTIANYNAPVTAEQEVCSCCSNKGRCTLICNFQSDTYQPGNDAVLMTTVDNSICTVDITNFAVTLKQNVNFRTRTGKTSSHTRNVRTNEFPGVPRHTSTRGKPQLMTIRLEESSFEHGKVIQPSVQGLMITCNYQLEVRPIFAVSCLCCSNFPMITVPMYIYAPELQNWISAIPQGFSPKVYDTCNIIVPVPSMKLDFNMPGANISMPGMSLGVSAPKPSISANISAPSMTLDTNANVSMKVGGNVGIGGAKVKMGGIGMKMKLDEDLGLGDAKVSVGVKAPKMSVGLGGPKVSVGGAKVSVGAPKMSVGLSGPSISAPKMKVGVSTGITGVGMNVGMAAPGMSMDVSAPGVSVDMSAPVVEMNAPNVEVGFGGVGVRGPEVNMDIPSTSLSMDMPGANVSMGVPGANVSLDVTGDVDVDVGVPGAQLNMGMGMPGMNMGVSMPGVSAEFKMD